MQTLAKSQTCKCYEAVYFKKTALKGLFLCLLFWALMLRFHMQCQFFFSAKRFATFLACIFVCGYKRRRWWGEDGAGGYSISGTAFAAVSSGRGLLVYGKSGSLILVYLKSWEFCTFHKPLWLHLSSNIKFPFDWEKMVWGFSLLWFSYWLRLI